MSMFLRAAVVVRFRCHGNLCAKSCQQDIMAMACLKGQPNSEQLLLK